MSYLDDPYNTVETGFQSEMVTVQQNKILSRIRNFSSGISSFDFLFSAASSQEDNTNDIKMRRNSKDLSSNCSSPSSRSVQLDPDLHDYNGYNIATDVTTPISTCPSSPQNHFFFSSFARSRSNSVHSQVSSVLSSTPCRENTPSTLFVSDESDQWDTPPLTPDSFSALSLSSSIQSQFQVSDPLLYSSDDEYNSRDDHSMSARAHSSEVREGKKPERPICYDTLIDDITGTYDPNSCLLDPGEAALGDSHEWYGLEYTLELSCRERRASEIHFLSSGEYSKSRESWAAIHLGSVDSYYEEEEEFYQWKRWHYFLDLQEQRRKERRTREFLVQSGDAAWLYKEEMRITSIYLWQKQHYGQVRNEVMNDLAFIAGYRPDPYRPAQNHNEAWILKRSRSVSCLHELRRDD